MHLIGRIVLRSALFTLADRKYDNEIRDKVL